MIYQNSSHPQGGYGGYSLQDDSGSSDGHAYSSSSGGSNRQAGHYRPITESSSILLSRAKTPEQTNAGLNRVGSPMEPKTPGRERSSFTLNGHQISETYKLRPNTTSSLPKPLSPASPTFRNNNLRQRSYTQHESNKPPTRNGRKHWALEQEFKVKIVGIPKKYWTKDVYLALSKFGTVTRIEIQTGSRENNAWVILQYVALTGCYEFQLTLLS